MALGFVVAPAATRCEEVGERFGRSGVEVRDGGIIRGSKGSKTIALVFTGHKYGEGGETILEELSKHKAKGSFFLTGEFLSNHGFTNFVKRVVKEGHYLGPHSDNHLLYCSWEEPAKTLVTRDGFRADLDSNLKRIEGFGVSREHVRYFLPPFEHYNRQIAEWSEEMGLKLVNYSPGTRSNSDYTEEREKNFVSSKVILDSILAKEENDPHGLNGFILLLHVGAGSGRTDKFHAQFGRLLDRLETRGYRFVRIDELLGT